MRCIYAGTACSHVFLLHFCFLLWPSPTPSASALTISFWSFSPSVDGARDRGLLADLFPRLFHDTTKPPTFNVYFSLLGFFFSFTAGAALAMIWLLLVFLLFHCNILLHRGKLVVEMVREVGFGQQCDQAEMVAEMQRAAQPQSSRWSGSQVDREKKHRCNRALTRLLFSHESGAWATAGAASFVGQMMVCSATLVVEARPGQLNLSLLPAEITGCVLEAARKAGRQQ